MRDAIKDWIAAKAMKLAMKLRPEQVRDAMATVFIEKMMSDGVVRLEFGFDEDGDPAIKVQTIDSLPRVTRH